MPARKEATPSPVSPAQDLQGPFKIGVMSRLVRPAQSRGPSRGSTATGPAPIHTGTGQGCFCFSVPASTPAHGDRILELRDLVVERGIQPLGLSGLAEGQVQLPFLETF